MKDMLNTKGSREKLANEKECSGQNDNEFVVKKAYLRKLKSMKKKYFVLRRECGGDPSRLDYYGSEKKFKNNALNAKRSIILKDCFSINRRCTAKSKYCIALYTAEDCVTLIFDNENEMNDWLHVLLELQSGVEGFRRPQYDHVWQVTLSKKGLGENRNMAGIYRLCLTAKSLLLFKVFSSSEKRNCFEFPLISIRRCGHTENYFFMDLGRSSCIGPGELWIMTEDTTTSHDMHETILKAMKSSKSHEDFAPLPRPRSASTSENAKPLTARRPTSGGIISPTSTVQPTTISSSISYASITTSAGIRDRCDSLPSRTRNNSECSRVTHTDNVQPRVKSHDMRPYVGLYSRTMSYSPPSNSILSPSSNACSTDSAGSSLSVDDYDSMSINGISSYQDFYIPSSQISRDTSAIPTEPPIREEEFIPDDYLSMDPSAQNVGNDYSTVNISTISKPVTTQSQQQLRSSLNLSLQCKNASSSPISSPGVNLSVVQSHDEGYIPMSPVGSTESTGYKSCSTRSSSIFERSSMSSDVSNGYVPMAPGATSTIDQRIKAAESDGYLDMTPLSTSLPKPESHFGVSPRTTSILSNVIPAKQLTEEFRLDKVKSYFAPEDDDSFDFIKPVRSYSMGSRPQMHSRSHNVTKMAHNHSRTSRSTLASCTVGAFGSSTPKEDEAVRVRAYSMGSQTTGAREVITERKNSIK